MKGEQGRYRIWIVIALLALCALGGGSSRADALGLLYLRPAAVLAIVALLWDPVPAGRLRAIRVPLLLLAAFAAIMLVQLIPLPPELWASLPGHGRFAEGDRLVGNAPWRPISLSPDLTLNALASMVVPAALLIGTTLLPRDSQSALLVAMIVIAALSALIGIAQLAGGADSPLYFYTVHSEGAPVGFFANRNHQAAFLAMAIPMLSVWAILPVANARLRGLRYGLSLVGVLFLVPMILATGSRAGLGLGMLGLAIAGLFMFRTFLVLIRDLPPMWRWPARLVPLCAFVAVVGAAVAFSRDQAFVRLVEAEAYDDSRFTEFPAFIEMARAFFPFGSGFGTFDPAFRAFEPDSALKLVFLNHAHNEPVELLITAGLGGALVLISVILWWGWRTFSVLNSGNAAQERGVSRMHSIAFVTMARLGSVILLLGGLASIVDYPARTPLMAAVLAISFAWLANGVFTSADQPGSSSEDPRRRG